MIDKAEIERALLGVKDQPSFLLLLSRTLGWPIEGKSVEDVSYTWTEKDLRAGNLEAKIVDSQIFQIANLHANQSWGIFVIEFKNPDAFLAERGMTGILRQVLRGLVPSARKDATHPSWKREHLLFICTYKYEHFRLAYFKAPPEGSKTAPLAAFGWGPDIPARTACEFNLPALEWPHDPKNAAAWVSAWAEAFNVEKVTKRFYTDYAAEFEKLRAAVKDLTGEDQKMFTQSLMNRLMFLRFIERKGWLTPPNGEKSKDYLRLLFAAGGYRGKSFYAGRLKKLFFEGLAIEGKQQSEAIGKVVFLNGGLFEESDLDKQVENIDDDAFEPLLGEVNGEPGLFYRYNFTVQESTPLDIEVAVDPEMLGKVFEELVTGRHESGSYYTPRPVVSFMCREALKGYLTDALLSPSPGTPGEGRGEGAPDREKIADNIAAFVDKHDVTGIKLAEARKIAEALDAVRAVDPACGSGAYLLGLLHEIVNLYLLLYNDKLKTDARELYRVKLDIIEKSLYGVDIDPFATNIAMLRLWLSLTVDSDRPEALPNLDFKIETGDSVAGPDPQKYDRAMFLQERARQLAIIKGKYMRAHGDEKQSLRKLIQKEQREIAYELRSLCPGAIDWRVQFCEIFFSERGGFDIVLANPPYISAIEFSRTRSKAERKQLTDSYRCAAGAWDLYVLFFERGVQLLRRGGQLCFINPNKYLAAGYAIELREYLYTSSTIRSIVDLSRVPVFENVSVYPLLTHLSLRNPWPGEQVVILTPRIESDEVLDMSLASFRAVQYEMLNLLPDKIWSFLLSNQLELLQRMLPGTERMGSVGRINATTTASEADSFGAALVDQRNGSGFKTLNTGTIDRYVQRWGEEPLTHQRQQFLHPRLPLNAITRARGELYAEPKIIFAKMAKRCESFWDQAGEYAALNANCFSEPRDGVSLGFIAAYVNSATFMFFYEQFFGALRMQGGYFQFQAPQLRVIPIKIPDERAQERLMALAQKCIEAKGVGCEAWEKEIDERVAALYGIDLKDL